jgi:hypothetical protein
MKVTQHNIKPGGRRLVQGPQRTPLKVGGEQVREYRGYEMLTTVRH